MAAVIYFYFHTRLLRLSALLKGTTLIIIIIIYKLKQIL